VHTPEGSDIDSVFDIKVVYQQSHTGVDISRVPDAFLPKTGPYELTDYEKLYAADPEHDIFELRGMSRGGAVVVVRPDQYVANVLPLTATEELAAFFRQILLVQ
jgi:phenol 2-monooxygenase